MENAIWSSKAWRLLSRLAFFLILLVLVVAALVVFLVGPWPLYADSHYKDQRYFADALAAIDAAAGKTQVNVLPLPGFD